MAQAPEVRGVPQAYATAYAPYEARRWTALARTPGMPVPPIPSPLPGVDRPCASIASLYTTVLSLCPPAPAVVLGWGCACLTLSAPGTARATRCTARGWHTSPSTHRGLPQDRPSWLRVSDPAERSQVDHRVPQQLHPIVPLLNTFKAEQQPLALVLPRNGSHSIGFSDEGPLPFAISWKLCRYSPMLGHQLHRPPDLRMTHAKYGSPDPRKPHHHCRVSA
jgi:hypothetical protein